MSDPSPTPESHDDSDDVRLPFSLKVFLAVIGAVVAAFIVWHLAGGGFRHHHM